jgi:bifunctional DNA-binding transcriptional regulator/antitoxin component of YhaV-PrlF toxin-antitoxin module
MPRLVKGGKFIYGVSKIDAAGTIVVPPPAMEEYGFREGDRVILMNGSRRSGGFGLTRVNLLEKSHLVVLVKALPELVNFQIPELNVISNWGRLFSWTVIRGGGCIVLSPEVLSGYSLEAGDLLVVGKGSGLAIGFIARGPIFEEAMRHPELELFE